jgi:phospholipase C
MLRMTAVILIQGCGAQSSVGSNTTAGTSPITTTATEGAKPPSASPSFTETGSSDGADIVNGDFESGDLSAWTATGAAAISTSAHSGSFSVELGTASPSTDSSVAQTFTVPAGGSQLSFWYQVNCPDTLQYDWASATLMDNGDGTTTTVLANTCTNDGMWRQATAAVTPGHSYTLTLASHDDNYPGDPTFTRYDDVVIVAAPPPVCPSPPLSDPHASERAACTFVAGARVTDTLGLTPMQRQHIPITHVVIVTQENRSFDHFLGRLPSAGQPDADGWPANFTVPDDNNQPVAPFHSTSTTLQADPPHQGAAMTSDWDNGKMDGFVREAASVSGDGHWVMGYYDNSDLPFFYWLANTFAVADRYFAPALGGTWANRDYLYAGTSDGVTDTGQRVITVRNIFNALDDAHVSWGVYTNGNPRQDCLGWTKQHAGVFNFAAFTAALRNGTLPTVSFVDPSGCEDEHPTNDIHGGEQWMRTIYESAVASPLWPALAIVITFDEAGGLPDHVAPPAACPPSADQSAFNNYGIRIPTILISPYARPHFVSHAVHDHTSALRLVEALVDLPALTARDANADALLDMLDLQCPTLLTPPPAAQAGGAICR